MVEFKLSKVSTLGGDTIGRAPWMLAVSVGGGLPVPLRLSSCPTMRSRGYEHAGPLPPTWLRPGTKWLVAGLLRHHCRSNSKL
jgi:hypothetical protein